MDNSTLSFDEWIKLGVDNNFVGPPICSTHDGVPMSLEEEQEFEEGNDPCVHILRLYDCIETKQSVEETHSPSVWRNPFRKPE